jgi:hypothetical protein
MSQELGVEYAIRAALAAEGVGPDAGPSVATGTDARSPHARRMGPAPAPRGRDPIRPEAFRGASCGPWIGPAPRSRTKREIEAERTCCRTNPIWKRPRRG